MSRSQKRTTATASLAIVLLLIGVLTLFPRATAQVWPFGREERVDIVALEWLFPYPEDSRDAAEEVVSSLVAVFPECAPHRYGHDEPLRSQIRKGELTGFFDAVATAWSEDDMLFFETDNRRCFGGTVFASVWREGFSGAQNYLSVSVEMDRQWAASAHASQRFAELADTAGAFFGTATVSGGYVVDRYGLVLDGETDWYPSSNCRSWCGIPAIPAWLYWLGLPYRHAVSDSVEGVAIRSYQDGILISMDDMPQPFDALSDRAIPIHPDYLTTISRRLDVKRPVVEAASPSALAVALQSVKQEDQPATTIPALPAPR